MCEFERLREIMWTYVMLDFHLVYLPTTHQPCSLYLLWLSFTCTFLSYLFHCLLTLSTNIVNGFRLRKVQRNNFSWKQKKAPLTVLSETNSMCSEQYTRIAWVVLGRFNSSRLLLLRSRPPDKRLSLLSTALLALWLLLRCTGYRQERGPGSM